MTKSTSLSAYIGGGSLADIDRAAFQKGLSEGVNAEGTSAPGEDGKLFLNFSGKRGVYALGQDKSDVGTDVVCLVSALSFFQGWTCWKAGKVVGREYWASHRTRDAEVAREDLEDHGPYKGDSDGWVYTRGFTCMPLTTPAPKPDKQEQWEFSSTSKSGRNAVRGLMEKVQGRLDEGTDALQPIIRFDREEFVAQDHNNFAPKFPIDLWPSDKVLVAYFKDKLSLDDLLAGAEKPAKKKKAA